MMSSRRTWPRDGTGQAFKFGVCHAGKQFRIGMEGQTAFGHDWSRWGRGHGSRWGGLGRVARSRLGKAPPKAGSVPSSVNGHPCDGYNVVFSVGVVMDDGRRYEREQVVFV